MTVKTTTDRRGLLKVAGGVVGGLVVGGVVGALAFPRGGETITVTNTVTNTVTREVTKEVEVPVAKKGWEGKRWVPIVNKFMTFKEVQDT
ncbi:MAG: hypothetical protein QXT66_07585, partial [Nitrososphaerota archaeon]